MKKIILFCLIGILSVSLVGAREVHSQENIVNYNEHELIFTKKEMKHFFFFPYIKDSKLTSIKMSGEIANSSVEEQLSYIKNIIKEKEQTILEHGTINIGYFASIQKNENNQQFIYITYKELSKMEYIDVAHNRIQIPHISIHSISFPIISEEMNTQWESFNGITYSVKYKGRRNNISTQDISTN